MEVESIDLNTLHMLLRRAPIMAYWLSAETKKKLAFHIKETRDKWATNKLLIKLLEKRNNQTQVFTFTKRVKMKVNDLLSDKIIEWILSEKSIGKDELVKMLQAQMFFSAKSSLCQSATFTTCAVESIDSKNKVFHKLTDLTSAHVNLIVGCSVDTVEYSFLQKHVKSAKLKVGRMIPLRRQVDPEVLKDREKVGCLYELDEKTGEIVRNNDLEIVLWDEKQLFSQTNVDGTGALLVPLCPTLTRKNDTDHWSEAKTMKEYPIRDNIVKKVLSGGSRNALKYREPEEIDINGVLKPWETKILEIPLDIGSFDADIGVVCVDADGNEIDVIHFPATYLDRVRTYPDGENRVQVEIKNVGTKPIALKNIYFRVRFYETHKKAREKCRLRNALKDIGQSGYYAVEHLIYTQVLWGKLGGGLTDKHKDALSDLINMDNLFLDGRWLLFSQKDRDGKKVDVCEVITKKGTVSKEIVWQNMTQREIISVFKNASSVGRENRRIAIFRNDAGIEGLAGIIEREWITEIFSIPGKRAAEKPTPELVDLCTMLKKPLTSLNIKPSAEKDGDLDLVWIQREKKTD